MSEDILYTGRLVSAKDAKLITDDDLPKAEEEEQKGIVFSDGDALWSYRNEGKINGYPVDSGSLNLPIERDDQLLKCFRPRLTPHSVLFWLSPDDPEENEKYNKLLQESYDGKISIVDEQTQYDAGKGKFMVWVRYNEVSYELHPRHSYLKEEKK